MISFGRPFHALTTLIVKVLYPYIIINYYFLNLGLYISQLFNADYAPHEQTLMLLEKCNPSFIIKTHAAYNMNENCSVFTS